MRKLGKNSSPTYNKAYKAYNYTTNGLTFTFTLFGVSSGSIIPLKILSTIINIYMISWEIFLFNMRSCESMLMKSAVVSMGVKAHLTICFIPYTHACDTQT